MPISPNDHSTYIFRGNTAHHTTPQRPSLYQSRMGASRDGSSSGYDRVLNLTCGYIPTVPELKGVPKEEVHFLFWICCPVPVRPHRRIQEERLCGRRLEQECLTMRLRGQPWQLWGVSDGGWGPGSEDTGV
jgi:hypothetical protein